MSTNFIAQAKEPGRSSGSMTLSWGLLNIPLSVFTGTQETRVTRKEFVDGEVDHPAGRAVIDKTTGEVVEQRRVVRMAEASTGQFVVLDDDEISACTGVKNVAEVLTFVPNSDILQYVPDKLMQVRPHRTKGIPDPAASKAFSLFVTALASQNVSALVRVALRGPAQYALVTATGDLLFVHSTEGVRKPLPMGLVAVTPEEQKVAGDLISSIGITSCPRLPDVTAGKVSEYVEQKAKGAPAPSASAVKPTEVVDIMAELTASIAAAKTSDKWDAPERKPGAGMSKSTKTYKPMPVNMIENWSKQRHHILRQDFPEEAGGFIEQLTIFEIEWLLQELPMIHGMEKRLLRTQLKWLVKTVERELKIVIDSPYDKNGKKRQQYVIQ